MVEVLLLPYRESTTLLVLLPVRQCFMLHSTIVRYGASGVWVGTRFIASTEAGAPPRHKELVLSAGYDDVVRTLVYSGRPMSVRKTPYVLDWYALQPEI